MVGAGAASQAAALLRSLTRPAASGAAAGWRFLRALRSPAAPAAWLPARSAAAGEPAGPPVFGEACVLRGRCGGGRSFPLAAAAARLVDRQQEFADLHRLALLDEDFCDPAGLRRGNFGDGFFGLDLEHDLARLDHVPFVNVDGGDIGGFNAFGDQRKFEFNRHGFSPSIVAQPSRMPLADETPATATRAGGMPAPQPGRSVQREIAIRSVSQRFVFAATYAVAGSSFSGSSARSLIAWESFFLSNWPCSDNALKAA